MNTPNNNSTPRSTKLVPGMVVKTYCDPITCLMLEGKATLIKMEHENSVSEYWQVLMHDDGVIIGRWLSKETRALVGNACSSCDHHFTVAEAVWNKRGE